MDLGDMKPFVLDSWNGICAAGSESEQAFTVIWVWSVVESLEKDLWDSVGRI